MSKKNTFFFRLLDLLEPQRTKDHSLGLEGTATPSYRAPQVELTSDSGYVWDLSMKFFAIKTRRV